MATSRTWESVILLSIVTTAFVATLSHHRTASLEHEVGKCKMAIITLQDRVRHLESGDR